MNYNESLDYIIKSYSAGKKRGFDSVRAALDVYGSPYKTLPVIHVAGTNGKGSVCALLNSVLSAAGYKTGMFTSPHLCRFNERFRINGNEIDDNEFAFYMTKTRHACESVFGAEEMFSFFEIFAIFAFIFFADKGVDAAILEVGIGGRLDTTNVAENILVSVITSISKDHTELLGNTLAEITLEKAGIIKKNRKTVLYFQCKEVYNLIREVCVEKQNVLYYPDELEFLLKENAVSGMTFDVSCRYFKYENLKIHFAGEYQLYNSATVLLTLEVLRGEGFDIPQSIVFEGFAATKWEGRMEVISQNPLILAEGAHNEDGIRQLCNSINTYCAECDVILVFAALNGKDYPSMVREITKNKNVKTIILTYVNYRA
ncbi:MAG: bifunctional folylpolyglutamate synthase/dihydrofolate synthase, partial [Clostridiales bacterium]|nr:bifunctional folylpolyglutamate synthase/dihydrofolate synthase [Clostridiales bacterium]